MSGIQNSALAFNRYELLIASFLAELAWVVVQHYESGVFDMEPLLYPCSGQSSKVVLRHLLSGYCFMIVPQK